MTQSNWTRRGFLTISLAALLGPRRTALSAPPVAAAPEDAAILKTIRARFDQVGLRGQIHQTQTAQFQGIGNAPPVFLGTALTLCERLGKDYRDHFTAKTFELEPPKAKMTVVVLADLGSFNAFLGQDFGPETGGIYDPAANWLVMFDNRPQPGQAAVSAERVNGFVLMHEAFHLLNYNTGLLSRTGDVPLCVSEGLGTYAETRRADGKTPIGRANVPRLQALALAQRGGEPWLPLPQLLAEDALFDADATSQRAYAQSWLLIHDLMQSKASAAKLKAYLQAIRTRDNPAKRLDDARAYWGDLDAIDKDLRKTAVKLLRRL